jgi:hypothetical protein
MIELLVAMNNDNVVVVALSSDGSSWSQHLPVATDFTGH